MLWQHLCFWQDSVWMCGLVSVVMLCCKDSLAKATPLLLVNEEGKHTMETGGLLLQRHGNNHRYTHQGIHSSCLLLTNVLTHMHMVGYKCSYRHIHWHSLYFYLICGSYSFKEWNKASMSTPFENKTTTTVLVFVFPWVMLKIRENKSQFWWKY